MISLKKDLKCNHRQLPKKQNNALTSSIVLIFLKTFDIGLNEICKQNKTTLLLFQDLTCRYVLGFQKIIYTIKRNPVCVCVCVCLNSSKSTESTSIKLGTIDNHPGVSVVWGLTSQSKVTSKIYIF